MAMDPHKPGTCRRTFLPAGRVPHQLRHLRASEVPAASGQPGRLLELSTGAVMDPEVELSWGAGELAIPVVVDLRSRERVEVVIWVRGDSLAVEFAPARLVVIDRETFQLWLACPIGALMPCQIAGFTVRQAGDGLEIGLKVPGAEICPLPDRVLALLRAWVL